MRAGKRGVAVVIASVFMILLVLVLASIVFVWARGFVEDKGEDVKREVVSSSLCSELDFDVAMVENDSNNYTFEAINRGNIDIDSLRFRIYPGGDSNVVDSTVTILVGHSVLGSVVLSGVIDRVEALGVLRKDSSDIVCSKNPVRIEGSWG